MVKWLQIFANRNLTLLAGSNGCPLPDNNRLLFAYKLLVNFASHVPRICVHAHAAILSDT